MTYKERAALEFAELASVRGEREAVSVIAVRYFVETATIRSWLGLPVDKEEQAEDAEQKRRHRDGKPPPPHWRPTDKHPSLPLPKGGRS